MLYFRFLNKNIENLIIYTYFLFNITSDLNYTNFKKDIIK